MKCSSIGRTKSYSSIFIVHIWRSTQFQNKALSCLFASMRSWFYRSFMWRQKSTKESLSNHKIWSLKELGTFHVRFIFRTIKISWNPFKDTFRNKRLTKPVESNRMTSLHTVKACNNRLFRSFNRLIFLHWWKRFWNPILFAMWIKS